MHIHIITPPSSANHTGNRGTADQYAGVFRDLGHAVSVDTPQNPVPGNCDILVALHAVKSHGAMAQFKQERPNGKLVVILTGTDIYTDKLSEKAVESMEWADFLVTLQEKALFQVPVAQRPKARTILQAVPVLTDCSKQKTDHFEVCVVGHLRDVKDPLRAAAASRLLPNTSRIRLKHVGQILEEKYAVLVEQEQQENPRYRWQQELPPEATRKLIAQSDLLVHSSRAEGGSRVIGEAVVSNTPVLASRIDGITGLIGDAYPGLFTVGDTAALASLMYRAESDAGFHHLLVQACRKSAALFDPKIEREAWKTLLTELHK